MTVTAQFIQNARGKFSVEQAGFSQYDKLQFLLFFVPPGITTSLSQMTAFFSGVRFGPAIACVHGKSTSLIG
jgi:hypothetical protein